jgi:hypothetical protein
VRIELRPGPPGRDPEALQGGPLKRLFEQEEQLLAWLEAGPGGHVARLD